MSRDPFSNYFWASPYLQTGEAKHFRYGIQVDRDEYTSVSMIDYPRKGVFKPRDFFNFCQTDDDISKNKIHTCIGRLIG